MIPLGDLLDHREKWQRFALPVFHAAIEEERDAVTTYGRLGFDPGRWVAALGRVWEGSAGEWSDQVTVLIDQAKALRDSPGTWEEMLAIITRKATGIVEVSEDEWLEVGEGIWNPDRAVTMAETEVVQSTGWAQRVAATNQPKELWKIWQSIIDDRTRETHLDANGQRQKLNDPYEVGGAALQYPADAGGPLSEIINCRCWEDYETV